MASYGAQAHLRKCTQGPVFLVRRAVVGRRSGRIGRLSLGRSAVFSDSLQLKAPAGWGEPGSGEVVEGLRLVIPVLTSRNLSVWSPTKNLKLGLGFSQFSHKKKQCHLSFFFFRSPHLKVEIITVRG